MTEAVAERVLVREVWGRDFTLYFLGVICSLTGIWMRMVSQGWLVYRLTDSAWQLGLVGFFSTLPILACAPLAGVVVDRVDRRWLLGITQAGNAALIVILAVLDGTGVVTVWQVMAVALLGGVISAFDWPTRLALVPNLVEPRLLPSAVALNSAAWNSARIGGPVVAGLLLPVIGTAGSFVVAAVLYIPVMLALPFIRVRDGGGPRGPRGNFLDNLRGGYAYILGSATLVTLLLMELVPIVFGQTFPILMPAFARDVLGGDARALGLLMAALGAGELIGTLGVAMTLVIPRRPVSVLIGIAIVGVAMVLFAQSRSLLPAMLCLGLAGLATAAYSTLNGTLIQQTIQDQYRGRVMSVYGMFWGLTPIGNLEMGALAEAFGVPLSITVNGLIVIAFVVILLLRVPHLRKLS